MIPSPLNTGLWEKIVAALTADGAGWEDICVRLQIQTADQRAEVRRIVLGR